MINWMGLKTERRTKKKQKRFYKKRNVRILDKQND